MMEVENLAEYRSLLRERSKAPLYHKIKHACMRQPAERRIIAAVLVCLSIGVTFIALKKSFIDSRSTEPILHTDEETLWHYNTSEEREVFLRLWNNANETLLPMIGSYGEQENGKYDQRSELFAHCELILETVKRSLKQCVSLQILPNKCKKLLLMKMKCTKDGIRYRNWDGSCNNLQHSDWGMTGDNFNRWLKATYTDDVSTPRQSVYGGELPPVRYLSNLLFSHKTLPDSDATMLFTHFGLFLDHDIVQVGQTKGNYSSCCKKNPNHRHPSCLRIDISEDDPLYGPLNVTCKGFLRSPPFTGTCPGRREQQNRMTSYIDASDMYGPSHEEGKKLRVRKKGNYFSCILLFISLLPLMSI
ncbi:Chorion peroxidase [Araneus ventricosus]|uniref:Chorion peroxidase n=1 Tax=Araneus ventricosus TaxID=182803 RepID=A0A4Y2DHS5_ARAVE|nr:Chorion peroxidase [Araneus ventricosus]